MKEQLLKALMEAGTLGTEESAASERDAQTAEHQAQQLLEYMDLILERNRQVNLTAITDSNEFVEKHYVDSLAAATLPEFAGAQSVMDLGTGGGFPGVPLAIAFPEKEFMLADSLNKRIRIIQEFCEEIGIGNVCAVHGRAEDLGRDAKLREHFDVCVSRAVADLRVLAEYCLPFVKVGGAFLAYKGSDCEEEVAAAEHAVRELGGNVDRIAKAGSGDHRIVVIRKVAATPGKYPRRAGLPARKPL